jgi:predicted DNA-binding WGR domain protein
MSEKLNVLILDRCDPSQNMSRFYVLRIERSLFGDPTLVREWGGAVSVAGRRTKSIPRRTRRSRLWKPGFAANDVAATKFGTQRPRVSLKPSSVEGGVLVIAGVMCPSGEHLSVSAKAPVMPDRS